MKVIKSILFITFITINAAIYESDDRELVYDNKDPHIQYLGLSVAAKLRNPAKGIGNGKYQIVSKTLNKHIKKMCPGERFENIETFSNCTGFLVREDLMVTAGHCLNNQSECDKSSWLFSSRVNPHEVNPIVKKEDIFKCETIISRIKNSISKNDYTLFKLTRVVKDREPLKFRTSGKVSADDSFTVLGHPTGLPLIQTKNANLIQNESAFLFKINSNTFGGNSGSPVFNQRTGLVEGILTDGDLDYVLNKKRGCMETFKCPSSGCKGENVVRITNIPELVPDMTPVEPLFDFDNLRL